MTKRKQNLMRRYLTEMLMRLDGYLEHEDVAKFLEEELDRTVEIKNARHNLRIVLGELIYYQDSG